MNYMQFQGPGFEMEIPTNWLITSSPQYQAMFLAPQDEQVGMRANLMVTLRPVTEDVTLQRVAEETRRMQEREYADYTVTDEVDFSEQGGSLFVRRYQWHNARNNLDVAQIQGFVKFADVLFTLTATRLNQPEQAYLDEIFEDMINSFRITPRVRT